jgi:hypothetical protein
MLQRNIKLQTKKEYAFIKSLKRWTDQLRFGPYQVERHAPS